MTNLDLKDRKILYQLDLNCRQSNSQIGKKVGLSKQVVDYRIKRMEEEGIIRNYYTVIDSYKLGYYIYRIYIKLQYISSNVKKRLIQHLVKYQKISTVSTVRGPIDLLAVFWVKDLNEFYSFWETILAEYGEYFAKQHFSIYVRGIGHPIQLLLEDKHEPIDQIETFGVGRIVTIDEVDYTLIQLIALHARMPIVDLAHKLGCSSQSVTYRIKKLMNMEVIRAFRVNVDLSKLGLIRFKVNIYLKKHEKKSDIVRHVRKIPNLLYFSSSIGLCDLEFEFIVENTDKLIDIIENIEQLFPGALRIYEYFNDVTLHIETFMPRLTEADFKK